MDPVQKMWMYEHWLGDQKETRDLAKDHAYLLASFTNPEAVKQMMNDNIHQSDNEAFEESLQMVLDADKMMTQLEQQQKTAPKRKRRRAKQVK